MAQKKYSAKAREKFADAQFNLYNFLSTGLVAAILLVPLGAVLSRLVLPGDDGGSIIEAALNIPPLEAALFIALYLLVLWLAASARDKAMSIYTELYPDADCPNSGT